MSTYTATKHALEGWCDAIRIELMKQNIQVSLVEPGSIRTPILDKTMDQMEQRRDEFTSSESEIYETYYRDLFEITDITGRLYYKIATAPRYMTLNILHAIQVCT